MTTTIDTDQLGGIALFHDLTPAELARIAKLLRLRSHPARATIMSIEQPGDAAYIILEGALKIAVERADGTSVILAILGPRALVGEMGVVQGLGRSATVTTLARTTLAWMPGDDFQECLRAIPAMAVNLTIILAQRLRLANAQILSFATQDVDGRIARMLLAFGEEHGRRAPNGDIHIPLRLTQSDLGSIVGASRVRVNQVMNDYKDAGVVSINTRNQITIHRADALAQRCE